MESSADAHVGETFYQIRCHERPVTIRARGGQRFYAIRCLRDGGEKSGSFNCGDGQIGSVGSRSGSSQICHFTTAGGRMSKSNCPFKWISACASISPALRKGKVQERRPSSFQMLFTAASKWGATFPFDFKNSQGLCFSCAIFSRG